MHADLFSLFFPCINIETENKTKKGWIWLNELVLNISK